MATGLGQLTRRNFLAGSTGTLVSIVAFPVYTIARPSRWARPEDLDGVPNLHRVSRNFYRSAQPTAAGMKTIEKMHNVRTVINLRHWHSDDSLVAGTKIRVFNVKMNTWQIKTEDVVVALKLLRAKQSQGRVLLHCQHGADRTGLITALYRITFQGWSKDQALDEMLHGDFGYHAIWGNIPRYVRDADVAWLKRALKVR